MTLWIGESLVGQGPEAAHTNLVLGPREGPAGVAFATALATPRAGHLPFLTVLKPNVLAKPVTLFVNKVAVDGEVHGNLTWGAAQIGLALGLRDAAGILPPEALDGWVCIAAVLVKADARDARAVFENQRQAARECVERALRHQPDAATVAAAIPGNRFFTP